MRNLFLILFISTAITAFPQHSAQQFDGDCARITFTKDTLDVGQIKHNNYAHSQIHYKSTGKCPLIVTGVKGLTMQQLVYHKKYLLPGDSGLLDVYYPSYTIGKFVTPVYLLTNVENESVLYLSGEIMPDEICAEMRFPHDTIDFGPVHYVYGKHFAIKMASWGKCHLSYTVAPSTDEYLNVLYYNHQPVAPGDSGVIDIHLGGQVTGRYYGVLNINSVNATNPHKTLFIKAGFSPPDKGDSTDTEISADRDMVDEGTVTITKPAKEFSVKYAIKNTGKKPLELNPSKEWSNMSLAPNRPIPPNQTAFIMCHFTADTAEGMFVKHISVSGNFKGKTMPLYIKGIMKK